jgi:Rieske 2Fe-2S family protein
MTREQVLELLRSRPPGHTLPGRFYNDPAIYQLDLAAVFERQWIFAAASCEITESGSYVTLTIGTSSIIVLRDENGDVRAFFNTCRHRGSRICDARASEAAMLSCPYHAWTYRLDGALMHAPHMPADLDKSALGLRPVALRELGGLIYVCLADHPPDFDLYARAVRPLLTPHGLERAKLAAEIDLIERGNWKLVMENSRECYHCRAQHPELMRTFLDIYDFANPAAMTEIDAFWERCRALGLLSGPAEGPEFRATRLPLTGGAVSITMDGRPAVTRRLGDVPDDNIGSLRWVYYPSVFNHALADYAVMVRMLPLGPQETLVTTKFLVDRDAVAGEDYDLQRLTEVWSITNDQDRQLVERNQAGVNSAGYRPGPYSPSLEAGVLKFTDWYCAQMERFLGGDRKDLARPRAA